MPELPEVESVRSQLNNQLGLPKKLESISFSKKQLRFPIPKKKFAKILIGQKLITINRHGKYLFFEFDKGVMISHLGMTGHWRVEQKPTQTTHDHVIMQFDDRYLTFNDPRRFGFVLWQDKLNLNALNLGPDALNWELDAQFLLQMKKKKSPIKSVILDQRVVAGIGNIYASEILFHAGVKPLRQASKVSLDEWTKIKNETVRILQNSIRSGGTTIDDYLRPDGEPGGYQQQLSVYGKEGEPCPRCRTAIVLSTISGRSTYWCKKCQK